MCALCGVIGGSAHWSDSASNPAVFQSRSEPHTWQRERQGRTRLVNAVLKYYSLKLADWSASSYVLRSSTGRTQMVENLSELWAAAERLTGKPCDPLDESLLAVLSQGGRS